MDEFHRVTPHTSKMMAVRRMRRDRLSMIVLVVVTTLFFTSCASNRVASPLSARQRAAIRTELLDGGWAPIAKEYPEAIRPAVTMAPTVADYDWQREVVRCLLDKGIMSHISEGSVRYDSGSGQTQLEVTVEFYECQASNPAESQVAASLTDRQSAALYNYYRNSVRPCLLSLGAPSPASPERSAAQSLAGIGGWNPYQVIWTSGIQEHALRYLELRCPPVPSWLNLEPQDGDG